jgi:hypothetical protein
MTGIRDLSRGKEPNDRLTRLCAAMTDALDAHPERADEKCVVFLQDAERGGLQLYGYEDDTEAMVDLLTHLKAIFESSGLEFHIIPMAHGPGQG